MRSRPSRRCNANQSQPVVSFPIEPGPHSWSNHESPVTASLFPPLVHQPSEFRRVRLTYRLTASLSGPLCERPSAPWRTGGFSGAEKGGKSAPPRASEKPRRRPPSTAQAQRTPDVLVGVPAFFNDAATPEIYPLSLHDALPIC